MAEPKTTRWHIVKGRAEFLKRVDERLNCDDINGEILTEVQRYAYAICKELDILQEEVDNARKREDRKRKDRNPHV